MSKSTASEFTFVFVEAFTCYEQIEIFTMKK